MTRSHAASIVEDAWNRRVTATLSDRGWGTRIIGHTGYGTVGFVRVLGRVLMARATEDGGDGAAYGLQDPDVIKRGWRAFITAPAMNTPVTVQVNDQRISASTDRSGYLDITVRGHGFGPGWHRVTISSPEAPDDAVADVLIVGSTQTFGIISDIDDTVITTSLPRPMIAAWNTFVRVEGTRKAVSGMAPLYRSLLAEHPGAPIVYVSTGAWNTAPYLTRFLRRNGFPVGPLLLTDWGPTNTGWFRSGQDHKRACLHRLARELPHITWVLIGDDGQHDPRIYGDFAAQRPDVVRAIAIRQLTPTEMVLSHGLPVANEEFQPRSRESSNVPECRAGDGYGLARLLEIALRRSHDA